MTDPIRIYRLWRTSGIMCTLGALEFGYLAYVRQTWWPLIVTVLLLVVAGLAFRRIRVPR